MLFMQSYFFCASVRLGVIIISIFAMAKSIVVMYIILTHGIDFLPMMIDKFDTESAYRESYFMVKDTIDWMEQDPKVATVLLQVYSISHIVSCLAAAYGAYKLKKLFVLPLACFEFTYLLQIVAMVILFLRISRHFLNLSSLILVTLIATAYATRQDVTYWHLHKLKYPVNLLRNVARLNAYTYYIMALDMQLLPPSNFAKKFIHFAWVRYWNHPDIAKPFASIYCLPTFPHTPQAPLAYNKQQLVKVLRDYNITKPIYNNNYLWQRNWLSSVKDQEHLYIYDRATHGICVGYISINELEPLYDEQYEMESIYQANNNLQCLLLSHLGYSFIIMDNVFLIRRTEDSWQSIRYNKTLRFARLHRLNKLKKLYNNLVSLPGVNNNLEWLINMAKKD
ncbi:CG34011 [Drosophila busckii]|uniref:CG34011 n=1 Tax=Drosophila busckii TaxID=30019 RepID=A0A0M4E6R1_DROBS|nr:CG34011 [Drosophila busckii]